MEINRSEYWRNRNYPKRGTDVNLPVSEMNLLPETLVYIGEKEGSGFRWIGRFKDVPVELRGRIVVEQYQRTVGYVGEILLLNDAISKKKKGMNGLYWNWEECDPSVEPYPSEDRLFEEGAESLLIAIMQFAAQEYRNDLNKGLRESGRKTEKGMRDVVKNVRMLDRQKIEILRGTSKGQYILQRLEDEAIAQFSCPNWDKMDYPDRQKYLMQEVQKMAIERVKQNEGKLYAHIKRRSVKHDVVSDSGADSESY